MSYQATVVTGSFTGNGTTQTITLPWTPAVVMLVNSNTGTATHKGMAVKFDVMPTTGMFVFGSAKSGTSGYITTNGLSFSGASFIVGSNLIINGNGDTIYWAAFKQGPWIDTGTYAGNKTDGVGGTQTIVTGRSSQNAQLMIAKNGTAKSFSFRLAGLANLAQFMYTTTANLTTANTLQYASNGFIVNNVSAGNPASLNVLGETFYYAILYETDGDLVNGDLGDTRTAVSDTTTTGGAGTTTTITLGSKPHVVWAGFFGGTTRLDVSFDSMPSPGGMDFQFGGQAANNPAWFTTAAGAIQIQSTGFVDPSANNSGGISLYSNSQVN